MTDEQQARNLDYIATEARRKVAAASASLRAIKLRAQLIRVAAQIDDLRTMADGIPTYQRRRMGDASRMVTDAAFQLDQVSKEMNAELGIGDGPKVLVSGPGVLVFEYTCPKCGVTGDAISRGKALPGEKNEPLCLACMEEG